MAVTGKLISQLTGEVTQPTGEEYMLVEDGGTSKKMRLGNLGNKQAIADLQKIVSDKEYDEASFSGLGRVNLPQNMVEGKNVLTAEMMSKPNTIYVIQYDFDLNGAEINIPEGCVLKFEGGSLSNGTIVGNNTLVNSNDICFSNISATGNFRTEIKSSFWDIDNLDHETQTSLLNKIINIDCENIVIVNDFHVINPKVILSNAENKIIDFRNKTIYVEKSDYSSLQSTLYHAIRIENCNDE